MRLDGIDGSNLFGFMAALGTLSLLDEYARFEGQPIPRLSFGTDGIGKVSTNLVADSVVQTVLMRLQAHRAFYESGLAALKKPTDFTHEAFNEVAKNATTEELGILAGLACCVGQEAVESSLCAANGASHQNLILSIRDILALVKTEHIREALFTPWRKQYEISDEVRKEHVLGARKPTLRLDPADERLYALRFSNPTTTDDYRTELGAQALAIPAFTLLPVLPLRRPVSIASSREGNRVYFSWAIWDQPATLASVRSFLATGPLPASTARGRGAFAAFRVARISGAKGKLSFAPTEGIW